MHQHILSLAGDMVNDVLYLLSKLVTELIQREIIGGIHEWVFCVWQKVLVVSVPEEKNQETIFFPKPRFFF